MRASSIAALVFRAWSRGVRLLLPPPLLLLLLLFLLLRFFPSALRTMNAVSSL
jgi:hypothetical protein